MTLNGVIALILRFSPNLTALRANYVTVAEVRFMSVKYYLLVPDFRGLSAISELLE